MILAALLFANEPHSLYALNERYDSVVSLLEKLRELRKGGPSAASEAGNSKQQLVLQRGDAMLSGHPLAKTKKLAKLVSKPRQALGQERQGDSITFSV